MCRVFLLVISSVSLALGEVEWVETRSNDEIRMTNDEGSPNEKIRMVTKPATHFVVIRHSSFVIPELAFPESCQRAVRIHPETRG